MKTLALLLLYISSYSQGCLKLDLVILGDLSGSVQGKEQFVSEAFMSLVNDLQLSEESIKVSIITFNSNAFILTHLTGDKTIARNAALSIRSTEANYGTDNPFWTIPLVKQIKASGVILCGVMIENANSNEKFIKEICSECYVKSDYESLGERIKQLDVCF